MKFLTIIDRYIIRQFFGGFLFTLILIVSVATTIDLGEKINKFVQHHLTLKVVLTEFYIYFIPYIITFLGPYFVFITVIYFTSRLSNKSEIIAIFNSGTSFARLLVPYIFTSSVIALILWVGINYIVPKSEVKRLNFENKYIAPVSMTSDNNIHRRIDDSTFFYFRVYDAIQKVAYNPSVEYFEKGELKSKILAEKGSYDPDFKFWVLDNYYKRTLDSNGNNIIEKGEHLHTTIDLDPEILVKRWTHTQELTRNQLIDIIADLKKQGSEGYKLYEIELYKRTSKCFGIVILTVIGVILASTKVRGGLGLHLMFGLVIGSLYEVIVKFSDSFAIKSSLSPMVATWIPNVLYVFLAFILWKKIQD